MKIYLAGPMTGYARNNFPAFESAAVSLRNEGHEVLTPHELDEPEIAERARADPGQGDEGLLDYDPQYDEFLERDFKVIHDPELEGVVLLPGWQWSRGARREVLFALAFEKRIWRYNHGIIGDDITAEALRILTNTESQLRFVPYADPNEALAGS